MEEKVQILPINPETFETQEYNVSDQELLTVSELDTVFSSSTDYIEIAVYDENQNKIYSTPEGEILTNYTVKEGDVLLSPQQNLEDLGFDIDTYFINYNFYRKRLNSDSTSKYFISTISSDRTEIILDSNNIELDLILSSSNEFIQYREEATYFVDFYLNFGNNQTVIANNIKIDKEQVLIKLYEPLPSEFDLKSTLWVVEEISTPQSYQVTFPFTPEIPNDFTYISGPNFNLKVQGETGTTSQDFSYDTLINSDVTSSVNQIQSLLAEKQININVNYEDFGQFVHFSSAKTRLENFYYKVGLIESASNQLSSFLNQITTDTTTTLAYSSSKAELTSQIDSVIKNFDGYEYFLYFNSGSLFSYPKSNTEPPYTLYSTGSTEVLNWIGSADPSSPYYGGIALSASNYDENNKDYLYWAIPEYLRTDPDNLKYELFVDMVGQHYDNIWLYTKDITNKFDADNRLEYGISKDLIADAIKDFGIKLYSNNFNTNDLYTAFLGITPSGSLFPFPEITDSLPAENGYEYVDTRISASNDVIPLDDINKRLYKRIYHNIPYLLKTKGTIAGLRALITSYGIPDTILRVNEFGGKDRNEAQDWDLKQNVFNYAFDTGVNATNYVSSSFNSNSSFGGSSPNTIQFRFKTAGIPTASANIPSSDIRYSQSLFSTDDGGNLVLEYTGSGLTTGSHSGSSIDPYDYYGTLKWIPAEQDDPSLSASIYLPLFNKEWWSVQVNTDYISNSSSLFVANQIDGKLGFNSSSSIVGFDSTYYSDASIGYLNKDTNITLDSKTYTPFSGSLQELRYFNQEISQSKFYDYVLNPYSIEGNDINSTPDQLFFRAALGTQLDTGSRTSIHPRVTGSTSQITQSFTSDSSFYINNDNWISNVENIYQDQVVAGIKNRVTDKVETENIIIAESPYGFISGSNIATISGENALSPFQSIQTTSYTSQSYTPDVNYLEVAFSPQNQINDDINAQLGYFNIGDYIGDPRQISSSARSYPDLDAIRNAYFEKYIKGYDVVDFVRLMKFFDNSLFKMIKDFTPARTSLSSGVVVKQHILERNRQRPAQASWSNETYSGSIKPQSRNYNTGSGDVGQYESTDGSSIYKFTGGTGGSFERFNGLQSYPESLNNRFNLTQSYSESIEGSVANTINNSGSFQGYRNVLISDQKEFYDGEFSGSNLEVTDLILNPDCGPYLTVPDTPIFFNPIFFSTAAGSTLQGKVSVSEFLKRDNSPISGDAWILSQGTTSTDSQVIYVKLSSFDINSIFIRDYLASTNKITLILPEGNIEYYINSVATYSTHVVLTIKQNIGDSNITGSTNGGSENWSLTASGNYRTGGTISEDDKESQGSFKNNVAVVQNQQFWYYNGDVADAQSFFHTGSTSVNLLDIESDSQYYGYGSYNPQRTSNINWFISCSIDYSASVLEGGNEVTQSGDFYKGYSYEDIPLTDQDFTLSSLTTSNSFIPSPYSINLPDGDIFNDTYNTQIPGNSGSESGEIGGNAKIGIAGTASFKYLAGNDSGLKFNIIQSPQTAPAPTTGYSSMSGSALYSGNGNFSNSFPIPQTNTRYANETGNSTQTPIISVNRSGINDWFEFLTGTSPTNPEYGFDISYTIEYSGSSGDSGTLEVDVFYSQSTSFTSNPDMANATSIFYNNTIYPGDTFTEPSALTNYFDDSWNYIYFEPRFKVEDVDDIKYKLTGYSILVEVDDSAGAGGYENFTIASNISQSDGTTTGGWNLYDTNYTQNATNPKVKAKWELRVTGSSGDNPVYELPIIYHPIIELSGSSPISVDFDTVDWGTIGPHINEVDDMYYLEYTLYDYRLGEQGGAFSTDFEFLSINNTGQFDTLQISQSVILEADSWDLTGSLRIYKGTEDNPVGDVLLSRQFIVPTDNSTGTFTLAENLPQTTFSQFKYNETYRMGVEVSKSFTSGLDITAYTMSIFPSSSMYAPLSGPPSYDNYKSPTTTGFIFPTYFGNDVLPFNLALDCQPLLNNYNDIRQNSFIMDVDYTSEGQTTAISNWYIDEGDNRLYPLNPALSLANVKVGQLVSTPSLDVFPPKTRVIAIDQSNGEVDLSANALSSHDQDLTVFFNDNSLLPVNQNQILEGTAVKATVQDSNYTSLRSVNPRYNGVKTTSNQLNIWSVKDTNTFGQNPVIELKDAYFGYFKNIKDLYPLLNDKISLDVTYLLDQQSNAIPPNLDKNGVNILEKTFPSTNNVTLGFISASNLAQELDDSYSIFKLTQKPTPILYTQTSSAGYSSEIPLSGSGRISMYDNNDASSFTDYSFIAQGTASFEDDYGINQPFGTYTQVLNPTEDITTDPYGASGNYTNPYSSLDGTMTFTGDVEKNPQRISMQTSFATSFLYESGTTELRVDIQMLSGSTGVEFDLEDISLKVYRTGQDPVDVGSIIGSGVNNLLRFITISYRSSAGLFRRSKTISKISNVEEYNLQRDSYYWVIENGPLAEFLSQRGLYTRGRGGSKSKGDITGLEFIIKANSGNYLIEEDDDIKFQLKIDMPRSKERVGNVLFPDDYTGPIFPVKISTIGERTALLAGDNIGSAPFWVYTGSAGSGTSILDQSILVMSSSNMNEAYGGAFYQGPLPYVPGPTEYFDLGTEPSDTQFPKITSPIEFFPGDEIRFGNNENHSYKILEVTPPESNIESGKGRIKIRLNGKVPQSINKDFFLIRRYEPKASSFIIDAPFPYSYESSGSNANGIIYPTFPTEYVQNSGSIIVTDLISKGVIT